MSLILKFNSTTTFESVKDNFNSFSCLPRNERKYNTIKDILIRYDVNLERKIIVGEIIFKKEKTVYNIGKDTESLLEDSEVFVEEKDFVTDRNFFSIFFEEKILIFNTKHNEIHLKSFFSNIIFKENDLCIKNISFNSEKIFEYYKKGEIINDIWSISTRKKTDDDEEFKEYTYKVSSAERLIEVLNSREKDEELDGLGIKINFLNIDTNVYVYNHGSINILKFKQKIKNKKIKLNNCVQIKMDFESAFLFFKGICELFITLTPFVSFEENIINTSKNISRDEIHTSIFDFFPKDVYMSAIENDKLNEASKKLTKLIDSNEKLEQKYHEIFQTFPFLISNQHKLLISKFKFDDENVPDFIGQRRRDNMWDIFEIKQPFREFFTKNDEFNSDFQNEFEKCERYMNYAKEQRGVLRTQKKKDFFNPELYYVFGYNLTEKQKDKLLEKEKNSIHKIHFITYNDLFELINNLKESLLNLESKTD